MRLEQSAFSEPLEKIFKAESTNLALTGTGDGKIRLNSCSLDSPKVILPNEAGLDLGRG